MTIRILLVCIIAALNGCANNPSQRIESPTATAAPVIGTPAHDKLDATLWMQTATEYAALMQGSYRAAQDQVLAALADPGWEALPRGERSGSAAGLPPAVIVDVDETILDNSPYQARQILAGKYGFDSDGWKAWCAERAARALPGALEFAQFVTAHGVTMIYISNRDVAELASTSDNLASQGFPLVDDAVQLLGAATPGCTAKGSDKGCRRKLAAQRYRILMLIGDNLGDFIDGVSVDRDARKQLLDPYRDWLGQRWFMLPNPSYGSWESALTRYPADPALKDDPRAAKRAALRLN